MHIDLSGKTAIVTGSSAGIGLAIARGLAEAGAHVVINGRSRASVDKAMASIKADLPDARLQGVAADLADAAGVKLMTDAVDTADILVNNASIFEIKPFFDADDAMWERYFQLNVMSGVRLSRHYLKSMIGQDWGRIVFISSESALNVPPEMIHYGFSKTAELSVSRGLAKFAAGGGVTVNSVLPGPTLSDGFCEMFADEVEKSGKSIQVLAAEFIKEHRPSSIIRRATSTEEVANLVVYVCSPQASGTTGAALRVDGGVVDSIC